MWRFALLLLWPAALPAADLREVCAAPPRFHTETVAANRLEYRIRMGGRIDGAMTRDPLGYWAYDQFWEPNLSVRLENVGDVPVVNPWLQSGPIDTRTLPSIVSSVVNPSLSDAERARRLWEFEIKNRFHATTSDDEVKDAVKRFNAYGYTLCGDESLIMADLWRTAGLRVRRGYPNGHSTSEVYYDGAWHLMDSDESIICLLRDNKTIASEAQIVADHDLMKRTHTYGPLHDDNRLRDEGSAALHYYDGERQGEHPSLTRHRMDYTLRPGESIAWIWNPRGRYHGLPFSGAESLAWLKRWRLLVHAMNGELAWNIDFTREALGPFLATRGVEVRHDAPFGPALYLTAAEGAIEFPIQSPYPIVGGSLDLDFARRDIALEKVALSISFDNGASWRPVWATSNADYARLYVDLDEFFPPADPARYEYRLRLDLTSQAPQPLVCVKALALRSTLQMARLAMPGLKLGDNTLTYTDESGPGRRVRITHAWNECAADVPASPPAALHPPDGGRASGTRITFRWQPPQEGPPPADYEFQLSEFADMRWVLSPNFHKLISRTADRGSAQYQLPYLGLLNPGQTYYWRVRARSRQGVWGPWSKVFSFASDAPAVPVDVRAEFDSEKRSARLSWSPGQGGSPPVRYRIYGSPERGFTASAVPYEYSAGGRRTAQAPANLLREIPAQSSFDLPPDLWRPFYRVAALDAQGRESGPSDLAELPHPLITTRTLPDARPGAAYQARIEVSASIGHLTSQTTNGKPYDMAFRDGDDLLFELLHAPAGLTLDSASGVLTGILPPALPGNTAVEVRVRDRRKGRQDTVRLPLRLTPAVATPAGRR